MTRGGSQACVRHPRSYRNWQFSLDGRWPLLLQASVTPPPLAFKWELDFYYSTSLQLRHGPLGHLSNGSWIALILGMDRHFPPQSPKYANRAVPHGFHLKFATQEKRMYNAKALPKLNDLK